MISRVRVRSFKRIDDVEIPLSKINVLVGGNNSGKSCILQGIHFGAALAQARRVAGSEQFPPERLRYCPTDDFLNLHHARRLTEGLSIKFTFTNEVEGAAPDSADVSLTRGRNGVVKASTSGGDMLESISNPASFFSIYVPGLAGISIREEYRAELVVNNGIARGDANLFLRNLLLRIGKSLDRQDRFTKYLDKVFPQCSVATFFNEAEDLWIRSEITTSAGNMFPLDMVGTGLLQAVQLLAYVTMYSPKLLLLDEPDAHLHPSNQRLLAKTLQTIVDETDTKVIIATHSRHLIDAFSESLDAKLFWVKNGSATPHADWSDIAVLMDLGALDNGERFLAGNYRYLVWTEDTDKKFIEKFVEANGLNQADVLIFSYQASSKVDAAKLMGAFVDRIRPGVRTIIHRDRDFMSDDEIVSLRSKYRLENTPNVKLFITKGSDIEAYFASVDHLSLCLNIDAAHAQVHLQGAIQDNQNEFIAKFLHKREEVKRDLYKKNPNDCPSGLNLLPPTGVPIEKAIGKLLLKRVNVRLQQAQLDPGRVVRTTDALVDADFQACLH